MPYLYKPAPRWMICVLVFLITFVVTALGALYWIVHHPSSHVRLIVAPSQFVHRGDK